MFLHFLVFSILVRSTGPDLVIFSKFQKPFQKYCNRSVEPIGWIFTIRKLKNLHIGPKHATNPEITKLKICRFSENALVSISGISIRIYAQILWHVPLFDVVGNGPPDPPWTPNQNFQIRISNHRMQICNLETRIFGTETQAWSRKRGLPSLGPWGTPRFGSDVWG